MPESIPAIVLGGSGYVGGELLRLLASHPSMRPAAVVSRSHRHEAVEAVFPNLRGVWPGLRFTAIDDLPDTLGDRCAHLLDGRPRSQRPPGRPGPRRL